jgi:hypothetical protein
MRFLTASQKQQRLSICEEFPQKASDDATCLSGFITANETWSKGYDLETMHPILPIQKFEIIYKAKWQEK